MGYAFRKVTSFQVFLVLFLTGIGLFMFIPIVFLFNHAFKPQTELYMFPPTIFVQDPTWGNFEALFIHAAAGAIPFSRFLFNSVFVAVVVLGSVVIVSTLAGYVLSKHRFHFKSAIMTMVMLSLIIVPEMIVIPRYLVVSGLGLNDTYFAHILPYVASSIGVFLMKQFIDQIPSEIMDAAKLDGARDLKIFSRIVIPLTAPAVATICIITFQLVYRDIITSTYYITKDSLRTMAYYAQSFTINIPGVASASVQAAISLLMFLPNVILFILFQRRMIETMLHSGVK